jgi:predicted nucleotidyltransferase
MVETENSGLKVKPEPSQMQGTAPEASGANPLVSKLRSALPRLLDEEPIRLAYLFGSVTTGRTTPFSDVDIALLVAEDLSPLDRLRLILRTQLALADHANIPNADVRIINDAPLVFRGRVVSDGILVYARDDQERIEFETATRLRYFDYLPIHKRLQDAFFTDLRERGLYG